MSVTTRACARPRRWRRHAPALVIGGFLCALALAEAIQMARTCRIASGHFDLVHQLVVARLSAAFFTGMLMLLRGRLDLRLGRQAAGVLIGVGGAFGTRMLIVLLDEASGDLLHMLDQAGVPALAALASPALMGCGLLLICAPGDRRHGRLCRRRARRAPRTQRLQPPADNALPKSPV